MELAATFAVKMIHTTKTVNSVVTELQLHEKRDRPSLLHDVG